eukprot:scaffold24968_cov96-Isochrysis_galbana.AAC.2
MAPPTPELPSARHAAGAVQPARPAPLPPPTSRLPEPAAAGHADRPQDGRSEPQQEPPAPAERRASCDSAAFSFTPMVSSACSKLPKPQDLLLRGGPPACAAAPLPAAAACSVSRLGGRGGSGAGRADKGPPPPSIRSMAGGSGAAIPPTR